MEVRYVEVTIQFRDAPHTMTRIPQGTCNRCQTRVYRPSTLNRVEATYREAAASFQEGVGG